MLATWNLFLTYVTNNPEGKIAQNTGIIYYYKPQIGVVLCQHQKLFLVAGT